MANPPDAIERTIHIDSDAETVFALISRPGWWVNEGTIVENRVETVGDISTVTHAIYGEFRIRTVESRPPGYVAYRWLAGESDEKAPDGSAGTLVEFWVETTPNGVELRVRESGFTTLPGSDADRRRNFEANLEGWEQELAAARRFVEQA